MSPIIRFNYILKIISGKFAIALFHTMDSSLSQKCLNKFWKEGILWLEVKPTWSGPITRSMPNYHQTKAALDNKDNNRQQQILSFKNHHEVHFKLLLHVDIELSIKSDTKAALETKREIMDNHRWFFLFIYLTEVPCHNTEPGLAIEKVVNHPTWAPIEQLYLLVLNGPGWRGEHIQNQSDLPLGPSATFWTINPQLPRLC